MEEAVAWGFTVRGCDGDAVTYPMSAEQAGEAPTEVRPEPIPMEGQAAVAADEALVTRLMARISELEERLYEQEFVSTIAETPVTKTAQEGQQKSSIGFLSALKQGLRQLEDATGYTDVPQTQAPIPGTISAPSQPQSRIVYYQAPPPEVQAQLQQAAGLHQEGTLVVDPSSNAATSSAGDWLSRLTFGARPAYDSTQSMVQPDNTPPESGATQPSSRPATPAAPLSQLQLGPAYSSSSPRSASEAGGSTGNWFSSLFKKERAPDTPYQNDVSRHTGAFHERSALADGSSQGNYYRYVIDPVDVAAEMEVTGRVRKAASEALMAAEERLREMQQQLEQAGELGKEIERLNGLNEAALAQRSNLEGEMMGQRVQLESMRAAQESLELEVDGMRTQAGIWKNATSDESDKLKQENQLLRSQMQKRLNELQLLKVKVSEADLERQRAAKDLEELHTKLQWLQRINTQLENSAQMLEGYRKQATEYQERFLKERDVRRRLHEQLQQARGNIRVMCRVRPAQPGQPSITAYPLEGLLTISPAMDKRAQEFEFDHVFGPDVMQQGVYEEVSPLVHSCADGYNVCIMAYGQTGSGKTWTMEGSQENPGLMLRALSELFTLLADAKEKQWQVSVAMLEIYVDNVHDLLTSEESKPLDVSAMGAGELNPGQERVPGLTWRSVVSPEDVQQLLREGSRNRSTAATALNAQSSRSHALLTVRVLSHMEGAASSCSILHLVDLAGSERVDKSEVTGQQMKEAQSINRSLSALGDVISALQRRTPHIPFRNSKLTQVLQDSLCGTSKVLLVCNISPEACSASESISSLNFASRAAQVELGQVRKADSDRRLVTSADRAWQQSNGSPDRSIPASHPSSNVNTPGASAGAKSSLTSSAGTPARVTNGSGAASRGGAASGLGSGRVAGLSGLRNVRNSSG